MIITIENLANSKDVNISGLQLKPIKGVIDLIGPVLTYILVSILKQVPFQHRADLLRQNITESGRTHSVKRVQMRHMLRVKKGEGKRGVD